MTGRHVCSGDPADTSLDMNHGRLPVALPSMIEADFEVVLREAQRGACPASTQIYEWLAPPVAGYLRAQGAGEPEDLVSEVFLCVLSGCASFSGTAAQFRAWVFAIAHSRLVDARRARSRAPDVIVLEDEQLDLKCPTAAGAEEEAMDRLGIDEVHRLLDRLTSDQRDVLALRLMCQMSIVEVATVLDKPSGAVRALQHRALSTLRRSLATTIGPPR